MADVQDFLIPNVWQDSDTAKTSSEAQQYASNVGTKVSPQRQAFGIEYDVPTAIKYGEKMVSADSANSIGVSNPVSGGGGSGGGTGSNPFLTGTITTTDATVTSATLASITTGTAAFVSAYITAKDSTDGYYANFVRNASIRSVGGTLTFFDLMQDAFTMRQQTAWDVDFNSSTNSLTLRVFGSAAQTIVWNYAVLIFPM